MEDNRTGRHNGHSWQCSQVGRQGLLRVEAPEEKCRCRGGDGVLVIDAIKSLWLKSWRTPMEVIGPGLRSSVCAQIFISVEEIHINGGK